MSHRCRDDWFWLSMLFIAMSNDRQASCSNRSNHREWEGEREYSSARPAIATPPRGPITRWVRANVPGLIVLAIIVALLVANRPPVPAVAAAPAPAPDVVVAPASVDTPTPDLTPLPIATVARAATIVLPETLALAPPEIVPLPSTPLEHDEPLTLADIAAPESTLLSTRFDIGSTREQVEAAQGRPPTYSVHGGSTLWWGSSKVIFTRSGLVERWVDGTPPLMIRR